MPSPGRECQFCGSHLTEEKGYCPECGTDLEAMDD